MLERLYQNKQSILKKSQEFFLNSNSLTPKIGCELEFFLFEKDELKPVNSNVRDDFIFELKEKTAEKFPLIYQIEKEQGESQIEVKTTFDADLENVCGQIEESKKFIKNFAQDKKIQASFISQPFTTDCGSALQFNISLHDSKDKNLFEFDEKILKNSIAGLLQNTDAMMIFLAPRFEDYERFSFETNRELFRKGKFTAPVNLSFGADNRTCAIRVPKLNRLEYRIAAADADPFLSISTILLSMSDGIENSLKPEQQIFGNAFDGQYQIKNFCKNLEEAEEKFFGEKNFIREKLEKFL